MFQRMYDSLPTSVLERVGVVRELLCVRYGIARRLCLAWTKWILLYNFYACSSAYILFFFILLLCTYVRRS